MGFMSLSSFLAYRSNCAETASNYHIADPLNDTSIEFMADMTTTFKACELHVVLVDTSTYNKCSQKYILNDIVDNAFSMF